MKITIYQVDVFAENVFQGNPAAVCPLSEWLEDSFLLKIAAENNLSETAFYVIRDNRVEIRWFTPNTEVDLCGHATLAAAFVLATQAQYKKNLIPFYSFRSGDLPVTVCEQSYILNFPIDQMEKIDLTEALRSATNQKPIAAFKGRSDIMLVFDKQEDIALLAPNLSCIADLDARGLIVTAKGKDCDFVSRFFGPKVGVNEDPVTGSAHTTLTPYWAKLLNKTSLIAKQISSRGGLLECAIVDNRVEIKGKAALYLKGEIYI